jgi:hypothetical protein
MGIVMKAISICALLVLTYGCTKWDNAEYQASLRPHHIKQFDNGDVVGEWWSMGRVERGYGNTWVFQDAKTGRFVEVSGSVQITEER